ncbi:MAG: BTAD domain-containing putative transcriptional regulator [Actinomycetes bacterium]
MSVLLRLLGAPSIEIDGVPAPAPRGRKAWALLAYLLLAERPPTRQRLAALLFPAADDPLAALRWSLAELRRSLRPHAEISGDPVRLVLADGVTTDVALLSGGVTGGQAVAVGGELLEGMGFDGCPGYETWLLVERRRLAAASEAFLHENALSDLGSRRYDAAVESASRLVAMNPLDENYQALLVRCLAASGHRDAALDQVARCIALFRRELGTDPSPAVRAAAESAGGGVTRSVNVGRAAAAAQLEAGEAAVNAGAVDAGLECLRRAVDEAEAASDGSLRLHALIALGGALVHGARGRDEEGAAVLHEALVGARAEGNQAAAARACRELGFVDVQAGRRGRAEEWLAKAEMLTDDEGELAAVLGVRGMNLSDMAQYGDALASLHRSVDTALGVGNRRQAAWSASLIGRIHLLRGEPNQAAKALEESMALVAAERWMAFAPWPESLRAEVNRTEGHTEAAADQYAHAFALACQLGDPCWEGIAARGSGLLQADAGDLPSALRWLEDGVARATRWPDAYQWVNAYVLDAACEVTVAAGQPSAARWVDRLAEVAARGGMRELVVRSHVHRARLGQPGAVEAATLGAADLENPVVTDLVASL